MIIKYREYRLLKLLAGMNDYVSISSLSERLHVTTRTVYSVIESSNQLLQGWKLDDILNIRGKGYYLIDDEKADVIKHLSEAINHGNVELSSQARLIDLALTFLLAKRPLSLPKVIDQYQITKSTANADIRKLQQYVQEFSVTIDKLPNNQFELAGKELDIRKLALSLVEAERETTELLPRKGLDNQNDIRMVLIQLEEITGRYLTDYEFENFQNLLLISLRRISNGHMIREDENESSNSEKQFLPLQTFFSKFISDSDTVEREYQFAMKVYGTRQLIKASELSNNESELIDIARAVVHRFEILSGVQIDKKSDLLNQLMIHLLATQNRVHYGMQFSNPASKKIKTQYPDMFILTQAAIQPFEKYWGKKLNDDEIGLIALYFGSEVESIDNTKRSQKPVKIVIVCGSGLGTSRMLQNKLHSIFSNIISSVMTRRNYQRLNKINADLVISTIPIEKKGVAIQYVRTDLPQDDIESLTNILSLQGSNSQASPQVESEQLIDIISQYASIKNFQGLSDALQNFLKLNNKVSIENEEGYDLSNILPVQNIEFKQRADSWQTAVDMSTGVMVAHDAISGEYAESVIQQINKYGPYMVVAPGVMLVHAKASDLDKRQYPQPVMSLIRFADPVVFEDDVTATLIFALYSPSPRMHLNALAQLTELLSNSTSRQKLFEAQTASEIFSLFLQQAGIKF